MRDLMIENTILCVKWGDKYDDEYVHNLKKQCMENCSVPFNFYCLTDKKTKPYDITLPTKWDPYYDENRGFFWAYRKCYMFKLNENIDGDFIGLEGNKFLFLDLDVIIHQDLKYFFDLPMDKPYIVRGWWNDIGTVKRNFSKHKSTAINSSVIRWDRGQLKKVYNEINKNAELVFFTYPSMDNYINHRWYNIWDEDEGFFRAFPKGDIYSWYKGNTFPDDMETRKLREDHKICLFNNSNFGEGINDDEIKELWK
jgi:hypothetical protein|tara:strand:+ start:1303 stop:2064 length:762 start_codon:yes stop_codon:yes gene_type:complete